MEMLLYKRFCFFISCFSMLASSFFLRVFLGNCSELNVNGIYWITVRLERNTCIASTSEVLYCWKATVGSGSFGFAEREKL